MHFAQNERHPVVPSWAPLTPGLLRLGLFLLVGAGICQARQINVAVNDLTARGVGTSDAEIIGERMRSALVGAGRFRVMERSEMDKILKEQAFQRSGSCDQSECAVEIGKLLSVDRMVVGSVGKIGEMYSLQARLLDVQTGEIVFTATRDYSGRIEGMLTEAIPDLARKLAEGALTGIGGKGLGDLYVATSEPGAVVAIDGEKQPGVTPQTIEQIVPGEHLVTVVKGTLFGSQQVNLRPDDVQKIRIEMRTGYGSLKIATTPDGAKAFLEDGRDLGETPLRADQIPAGKHHVRLELGDRYMPTTENVVVGVGEMVPVKVALVPAGVIRLQGDLVVKVSARNDQGESFELSTDGKPHMLPTGNYTLRLVSDRMEPWSDTFVVTQETRETRQVPIIPRFGGASITSTPEANGEVSGQMFRTPLNHDALTPGEYQIRLTAPSYADTSFQLEVRRGKTAAIWIQMRHDQVWMDSVARVGRRKVRRNLGILQIVGSVGCGFGGYLMHQKAFDHKSKANEAHASYLKARTGLDAYKTTYETEIDEANSAQTTALWLDAAAAGLAAGALFTLRF